MESKKTKYILSNWYYIGILLMLSICSYFSMADMDNMAEAGKGLTFLAMVGLAVVILFCVSTQIHTQVASPCVLFCSLLISLHLDSYRGL